jgi:isopenicillin-N epimerase
MAQSPDWENIRNSIEFDPSITYLNTGTSGLIPRSTHTSAMSLRAQMHRSPTDYCWRSMAGALWDSRSRLANHMGTLPDRMVFFANISQAINTFCLSVDLPPGSEILLSDHEYEAMRWAWERAAKRKRWTIVTFSLPIHTEDPVAIVAVIESSITKRTKLLFLSHILYTTGLVLPMQAICTLARSRQIMTFVDGAHAPGMVPLDLSGMDADFYAANLHKWFFSPVGAAFLHCHPRSRHVLRPWQVSWGYFEDRSDKHDRNEFGSTPWIRQFEMEGTRDVTPWFLIAQSCDFVESIGYPAIGERHRQLSDSVRLKLNGRHGFRLCTPNSEELRGGLTSFLLPPEIDGQKLRSELWENDKIEINVIDLRGRQYFRVSAHVYNTDQEIEKLSNAIARILGTLND